MPDNVPNGPFGDAEDPFGLLAQLGDLAKAFAGQAPSWETARQLAAGAASGGASEPNVDPAARIAFEELGRVAELHLQHRFGQPLSPGGGVRIEAVTRAQWATRTVDDYRELLETLGGRFSLDATGDDPLAESIAPLLPLLGPMLTAMAAGSMVGQLGQRALGQYVLPIPRPGDTVMVVPAAVDAFAEGWSLPPEELRLWVCLHELAHHGVLSIRHVADHITGLVQAYVAAFRPDPEALDVDLGDPDALMAMLSDPVALLASIQTDEQRAVVEQLSAAVDAITGYADHVMDRIGTKLIPSYAPLTEAMRRERVEASSADRFTEGLLGLVLTQDHYARGSHFTEGVVERAKDDALDRLWREPGALPTPAEIAAPGLWLARLDLGA